MIDTKYILEYSYGSAHSDGDDWREEDVFNSPADAQRAFMEHVKDYSHTRARVRKVRYVTEEDVIAAYQPIRNSEFED